MLILLAASPLYTCIEKSIIYLCGNKWASFWVNPCFDTSIILPEINDVITIAIVASRLPFSSVFVIDAIKKLKLVDNKHKVNIIKVISVTDT